MMKKKKNSEKIFRKRVISIIILVLLVPAICFSYFMFTQSRILLNPDFYTYLYQMAERELPPNSRLIELSTSDLNGDDICFAVTNLTIQSDLSEVELLEFYNSHYHEEYSIIGDVQVYRSSPGEIFTVVAVVNLPIPSHRIQKDNIVRCRI